MTDRLVAFIVTTGGIFAVVVALYAGIAWAFTLLDKEGKE